MHKIKQILNSHLSLIDIFACGFLSLAVPLANDYVLNHSLTFSVLLVLRMMASFLLFSLSVVAIRAMITKLANRRKVYKKSKFCKLLEKLFNSKYSVLLMAAVILMCWMPALVMLYPGTMINDSWGQLEQVLSLQRGSWVVSAHHPVFDTFFMSSIIIPFAKLFGNWHVGMFCYVLFQAVCTSLVFAYSIKYMKDKFKQNDSMSLVVLLIYMFLPVFVASVQSISKDALSAWIFVLFVIQFIEIIRTKGLALKRVRFVVGFIMICLLCILTKKVELYIILLSLLSVLIFQKGSRLAVLVPACVISLVAFLILPMLRSTFGITPSGPQEMLSVPFQQTANYVKTYADDVTDEEKQVLEEVLEYDRLAEQYDSTNADPVKGYEPRGESEDYKKYLGVWLQQGFKHPDAYLTATAAHLAGWYSFYLYKPLTDMEHHTQIDNDLIMDSVAERSDLFRQTSGVFDSSYEGLYSIPIIGVLFTYAFFATIAPAFVVCTLIKRRKTFSTKYVLAVVPLVLSIVLGCYLSPVSTHLEGARYLYPVIYVLPTFLMLVACHYSRTTKRGGRYEKNL